MNLDAYRCPSCGTTYGLAPSVFRCACGSLLDIAPFEPRFSPDPSERSLFRYAASMPPVLAAAKDILSRVSMGEGLTPLVPLDPADPSVLVKVDYAMPTLSFKDRGAAVLVAAARASGARHLVQDSSGNAGASVAAYAARAGLACDIYAPATTSPGKVAQIEAFGARAVLVPGSREDTAAAALDAAENGGGVNNGAEGTATGGTMYASHVYNPFFYQGTKTYVYELFETLGKRLPDTLYLPLGNGTLVLGAIMAMDELFALGLVPGPSHVVAVQAAGCAPVYRAWSGGAATVSQVHNAGTAAEGIAIAAPLRGTQVLAALRRIGAEVVLAPEDGIAAAARAVAARGFHIETTSAATFAAFFARRAAGMQEGTVVLPLCGAGLKSMH